MTTQTQLDDADDEDGDWMAFPDPVAAAAYATPFPDFEPAGDETRVRTIVYDLTIDHMVRLTDKEAAR